MIFEILCLPRFLMVIWCCMFAILYFSLNISSFATFIFSDILNFMHLYICITFIVKKHFFLNIFKKVLYKKSSVLSVFKISVTEGEGCVYVYILWGGGVLKQISFDVLSAAAADKGGCKKLFHWIRVLNIQRLLRWTNSLLPYYGNVYVLIAFFVVWIYIFWFGVRVQRECPRVSLGFYEWQVWRVLWAAAVNTGVKHGDFFFKNGNLFSGCWGSLIFKLEIWCTLLFKKMIDMSFTL